MFEYLYGTIRFAITCAVVIAVVFIWAILALVAIVGAVVMGVLMPSRTVRGQLRSLVLNADAGIDQIRALRPS